MSRLPHVSMLRHVTGRATSCFASVTKCAVLIAAGTCRVALGADVLWVKGPPAFGEHRVEALKSSSTAGIIVASSKHASTTQSICVSKSRA